MTIHRKPLTDTQTVARDARRARFSDIATKIGAMTDDQRATLAASITPTTVEGRPLSVHNACLLAIQCPTVTLVGGFQQWLKAGRAVRKGEHGLMIWAPVRRAEPASADPAPINTDSPNFILVTVFDVSQTDIGRTA